MFTLGKWKIVLVCLFLPLSSPAFAAEAARAESYLKVTPARPGQMGRVETSVTRFYSIADPGRTTAVPPPPIAAAPETALHENASLSVRILVFPVGLDFSPQPTEIGVVSARPATFAPMPIPGPFWFSCSAPSAV